MVNLRELLLKGRTTCDCGHTFIANDIKGLMQNKDYQFYGGRVAYYSETICPDCKKECVILLEPYNSTYRVIDIGIDPNKKEIIVEEQKTEQVNTEVNSFEQVEEKEEKKSNEFICPNCKKVLKSKSGLTNHKKSCIKNG